MVLLWSFSWCLSFWSCSECCEFGDPRSNGPVHHCSCCRHLRWRHGGGCWTMAAEGAQSCPGLWHRSQCPQKEDLWLTFVCVLTLKRGWWGKRMSFVRSHRQSYVSRPTELNGYVTLTGWLSVITYNRDYKNSITFNMSDNFYSCTPCLKTLPSLRKWIFLITLVIVSPQIPL